MNTNSRNVTYSTVGDYQLPNLTLNQPRKAAGQVRQAAPDVPDAVSPGTVQFDAPERDAVPASDGTGADGREPDAADHGAASEAGPSPGQSAEPTDVGAAHEQSESAGRGTGDDGADLQLSFLDANIPTEAQQIEKIDQAESEKNALRFCFVAG